LRISRADFEGARLPYVSSVRLLHACDQRFVHRVSPALNLHQSRQLEAHLPFFFVESFKSSSHLGHNFTHVPLQAKICSQPQKGEPAMDMFSRSIPDGSRNSVVEYSLIACLVVAIVILRVAM